MCPPEDIVGGGGHSSVISFFKRGLHSDPFQTHEIFYFFLSGGEFVGIATLQNMQRSREVIC